MNCKECGFSNKENSRFCTHCGAELETAVDAQQLRKCPACEFRNKPDSTYCGACGVEMRTGGNEHRRKHGRHQEHSKKRERGDERRSRFRPIVVTMFVTGVVILLVLALDSRTRIQDEGRPIPVVESKSNDPALEAKVLDVAAKFICSCGTCGEQPLDVCACNTAVQERQYIRTSLQAGQSREQVAVAIRDKYGWEKPEFSAKIDSLASKSGSKTTSTSIVTKPGELRIPDRKGTGFSEFPLSESVQTTIATTVDRDKVFSNFKCPCGQCGIDELKDCGCSHPRGATEVKGFVDGKIRENRYTVAQLIDAVEKKYGNRKL